MSQKCCMQSCEFDACDTEQIWVVDPSNTSEKPVCGYHSALSSFMRSRIAPTIMFATSAFLSIFLIGTSSVVPFILSFFISILLSGLIFFTALMSLEIAVRYFFMDVPLLRVSTKTKKESGKCDSHSCTKCGEDKEFKGVWKKYSKSLQLVGTPVKTYSEGINVYCESCFEDSTSDEKEEADKKPSDADKTKCLN